MRIRMKLRTRLTIYLIVLVIFATVSVGTVSIIVERNTINASIESDLVTMGTLAKNEINGDALAKIRNVDSENSVGYLKIQDTLRTILESTNNRSLEEISKLLNGNDEKEVAKVKENMKLVYAYTVYTEGNKIFYGVDAYPSTDKKNHSSAGSIVGTNEVGKKASTTVHDQIFQVINGKGPLVTSQYKDDFGTWRTGIVAVKDHSGRIIGAVCLDTSVDSLNKRINSQILNLILYTVILLLIVIVISVLLSRKISKPIIHLTEGVSNLVNKRLV